MKHWKDHDSLFSFYNSNLPLFHHESQFNRKLDFFSFLSLKFSLGLTKSQMATFSFTEQVDMQYAQETLKRHFITVQGYSALKNLIYASVPVQRGRQVKPLKESRAQCEHAVCIYSGVDGR